MSDSEPSARDPFAGMSLADIESVLRCNGRSEHEIAATLALIAAVREQLARLGKWPPVNVTLGD